MRVFILLFQRVRIPLTSLLFQSPVFASSLIVVVWNLLSGEGYDSQFLQLLST